MRLPIDIIRHITGFDDTTACALYPFVQPIPSVHLIEYCIHNKRFDVFRSIFPSVQCSDKEARKLLEIAIKSGHMYFVRDIYARYPFLDILTGLLNYVVYDSNIELVEWMISNGAQLDNDSIYIAVTCNCTRLLKHFLDIGADPSVNDNEAFWVAYDRGYWDVAWMLYDDYRVSVPISPHHLRERIQILS